MSKKLDIRSFKAPHQPLEKIIHAYPCDKIPNHIRNRFGIWYSNNYPDMWFITREKRMTTNPKSPYYKYVYKNVGSSMFRKLKLTKLEDCELYYKKNYEGGR